jgi:hypothetical protein
VPALTLRDALMGIVDANLYPIAIDDPLEARLAIGYPFVRPDGRWMFQLFRFCASSVERLGSWDADADSGWYIEEVDVDNKLTLKGDSVGLEVNFREGGVGTRAVILLNEYPAGDSVTSLLRQKYSEVSTWERLVR